MRIVTCSEIMEVYYNRKKKKCVLLLFCPLNEIKQLFSLYGFELLHLEKRSLK